MSAIRLTVKVQGVAEASRTYAKKLAPKIHREVAEVIAQLGRALQRRVRDAYLNGPRPQRLAHKHGTLARSINVRVEDTPTKITASVGTNIRYGVMWETTGHGAYVVWPDKKKALWWPGLAHPIARAKIPAVSPRPFLQPAWKDMQPMVIKGLGDALRRAARRP